MVILIGFVMCVYVCVCVCILVICVLVFTMFCAVCTVFFVLLFYVY